MSQSLHFLRAFQPLDRDYPLEYSISGRNPFIFLGHFNRFFLEKSGILKNTLSQSLHFLRAFQLSAQVSGYHQVL